MEQNRTAYRPTGEDRLWRHERRAEFAAAIAIGMPAAWFAEARRQDPMATARPCLCCGVTSTVRLHFSRTSYHYSERDLAVERPDSNAPIPLCLPCARDNDEHWDEMWASLYDNDEHCDEMWASLYDDIHLRLENR